MTITPANFAGLLPVTGHSTLRCAALYGRHAPVDAAKMAIRALEAAGRVGATVSKASAVGGEVAPATTGVA